MLDEYMYVVSYRMLLCYSVLR